jgi:methyl-accepting chemotaxis protein
MRMGVAVETEDILKNLKRAMGVAGILCGTAGIIATIATYFILSPLIDRMGATAVIAMDHAGSAVDGLSASLDSASNGIMSLSDFFQNMSTSLGTLENGSSKFSSSLLNMSQGLGSMNSSIPASSLKQLNDSASSFSEFSTELENARSSLSSASSSMVNMSSDINSTKESVANAKADVNEAKDTLNRVIGGMKLALLVGIFIVILFFLTLMFYSVGILL